MRNRVLVIDDDPDLRELCAILMRDWGLTVLEAGDCASGLSQLQAHRAAIRVVLLDYFMPGLDPQQCTEEVRSRVDPGVPIVLLSAAVDIERRATELGLERYLAKPFDISELRAVVLGSE